MKKLLSSLVVILAGCGGATGPSSTAIPDTPSTTVATIQQVQEPLCSVKSNVAPVGFNGSYSIPVPTQRLDTNIQRSIGFKDYAAQNNCEYTVTLNRLQALGVDRVWVYNYGTWDDLNKDVWSITDWQISKSTMQHIVSEAKKRNIKVFLAFQFTGSDIKGNTLPYGENISAPLFTKMLNSHKKMITEYAEYAETIGVSGISLDWNAFYIPNMNEHSELWATSIVSIANAVKSKFSGKITYGEIGWPYYDSRIYDVVDELHLSISPILNANENANISVALLKEKYSEMIRQYASYLNNTTKPINFEITVQSIANYYYTGGAEDGFCVNNCIQNGYATDFSLQAMGVEAALEAIASQTSLTTNSVNFHTAYWHTDTLMPGPEGFPNLSQSIRGKPAEKIVKYWFSRG